MPYLNVENWEHCKEFVDYLYSLHRQVRANPSNSKTPTQFEELMDLCQQIHERSYSSRLSNLYNGKPEYSHQAFTKKVVEWMNDPKFLDAQSVNYPFPVRFDESFAPNLAYVFEVQGNRNTKPQKSFMAAFDSYINFWQRLNQPSWQKNLLWFGLISTMFLSSLASFGAFPTIPIVIAGSSFLSSAIQSGLGMLIGMSITGGVGYFLDSREKSNQGSGLYRDRKVVHGVTNPDFTKNFENFNYKPLTRKPKLPLANEPQHEEAHDEVELNNQSPRNGRK